jgi:hypothetical protein
MNTDTPYAASVALARLPRTSPQHNDTHDSVGLFGSETPLGYPTMSNQDAAARQPSPSLVLTTTEVHTSRPYAAIGALPRLHRPSPLCNDTIIYSLIH